MNGQSDICVPVKLDSRSYDIIIGNNILSGLGTYLTPIIGEAKVHIVTDENVHHLHGAALETITNDYDMTVLPAGESQKSFSVLQKVLAAALEQGLGRNDVFIAFGGGVIGDLTGFAASIYKRGCRFIQIPTTLLAQVDSSVGGKTAINVPQGKNLIGAFYQPSLVLSDMSVLKTLPPREVKAGYAEILKYGLLGDRDFFDWLETHGANVISLAPKATARAVATSCKTKARIVSEDERERGSRALLNLGHTFGHALETEAGYSGNLLHGEAVSAGMDMAFEFSAKIGVCEAKDVDRLKQHLMATEMPTIDSVRHLIEPERLMMHMDQDKKNELGNLTLILARKIGDAYIDKNADKIALCDYFETMASNAVRP